MLARLLESRDFLRLPEDLLVKVDRMTMAHSLEARSPLLDHELLELSTRIPAELKVGPAGTKLLLREAVASFKGSELEQHFNDVAGGGPVMYLILLTSAVELTRAVLPEMREQRWGRILNVTSIAVKQPVDGLMLSNSLRAAVTGFARTLANEVARYGVTVNNMLPGYTRTERVEQLNAATAAREGITIDDVAHRIEAQIPMRRLGEPREFAALAAFLASEQASYITGQSIAVDGGWIRSVL